MHLRTTLPKETFLLAVVIVLLLTLQPAIELVISLRRLKDAGNDGLEDVLAKLYATKLTKNTPSALAYKREHSMGLEDRFGTTMDSIIDSVGSYSVRSLPYPRAIIKASFPS